MLNLYPNKQRVAYQGSVDEAKTFAEELASRSSHLRERQGRSLLARALSIVSQFTLSNFVGLFLYSVNIKQFA